MHLESPQASNQRAAFLAASTMQSGRGGGGAGAGGRGRGAKRGGEGSRARRTERRARAAKAVARRAAESTYVRGGGRKRDHLPSTYDGPLPGPASQRLKDLTAPHVQSFNYMLEGGIAHAVSSIPPREVLVPPAGTEPGTELAPEEGTVVRFWVEDMQIGRPTKADAASSDMRLLPSECRERGITYDAPLTITLAKQVGDEDAAVTTLSTVAGSLPIMVQSAHCHLSSMGPKELAEAHEEPVEAGGYFICNGIERIIRMLQIPRRNHPMAITRSAYVGRGRNYSNKAVSIRCVRDDQCAITLTLHYLTDGTATVRFSVRKQEFFIPVVLVLKALRSTTDREIYERAVAGDKSNTFLSDRIELMLQSGKSYSLHTRDEVLAYLGHRFRVVLDLPDRMSDKAAGAELLRRYVLIHLDNASDKFELLLLMLRKLYGFVSGTVVEDNADALMNQEILLAGHLYQIVLREKIEEWLMGIQGFMRREIRVNGSVDVHDEAAFRKMVDRQPDIGKKIYYLLATGNLVSPSGLDLMQVSGYTVVADKINFLRYMTHFRSVHRGQFFAEMKTTTVRKLLPESWGFLCPVHTPDGAPCGLLNHLAAIAAPITHPITSPGLPGLLAELGMTPKPVSGLVLPHDYLPVLLDGRILGGAPVDVAYKLAKVLRKLKARQTDRRVPTSLEVAFIPPPGWEPATVVGDAPAAAPAGLCGPLPGLFLFLAPARLTRPTRQLESGLVEQIGPMEQVYMEIAVTPDDVRPGVTTHIELSPMSMLSLAASLTPFSDMNQSPRNMYQCQMGKQTMGTPCHSYAHRTDNKMYRIQSPQVPIVQTQAQADYAMDEYPAGTNAVVAVIAYTGFDMEDAMIINKSAYERGFGHGSVYKMVQIDLTKERRAQRLSNTRTDGGRRTPGRGRGRGRVRGGRAGAVGGTRVVDSLDEDGLPRVGAFVKTGDPLYCVIDELSGRPRIAKHKEGEPAYIDEVRILGSGKGGVQRASIKLRFNRNPVVGDKFSSRHGQKGVLSVLYPQEDMPFTESGMSPDVIINPHAFPSRMTIGMLCESMAGKAGALHGRFQDATPFRFSEKQKAVEYFGEQLRESGYHYYGSEPLYSGTTGTELRADIYIGLVYYQRLRHMVSDKSQVRSTGPINQLTRQPVKGRKHHGGIRFGEMERDSLLSHGTSFLLHDRLMNCSDRSMATVCRRCGSLLSTVMTKPAVTSAGEAAHVAALAGPAALKPVCKSCGTGAACKTITVPYVFRYLTNELAGMNIRVTLDVK